jgi:hypothetical protein
MGLTAASQKKKEGSDDYLATCQHVYCSTGQQGILSDEPIFWPQELRANDAPIFVHITALLYSKQKGSMFCKYTKEIVHLLWCGSSHVKLDSSMLCRGGHSFSTNILCQRGSCSCRTKQLEREPWPRELPKKTNMGPSIPLANSNQAMGHGTQTNAQEGWKPWIVYRGQTR